MFDSVLLASPQKYQWVGGVAKHYFGTYVNATRETCEDDYHTLRFKSTKIEVIICRNLSMVTPTTTLHRNHRERRVQASQ